MQNFADHPFVRFRPLLLTLLGTLAGMTAYEELKTLLLPHLTLWQSHAVTIVFSSLLATFAAFIALRRAEAFRREVVWQAEKAQRVSRDRAAAVHRCALDAAITIDRSGRVLEWNPAADKTFGYSHDEALGEMVSSLIIPPSSRAAHTAGMAHWAATGEGPVLNRRVEVVAMRRGGEEFPAELIVTPIQEGEETLFMASVRDISEQRQSEKALRASEARFQRNAANAPGMMYQFVLHTDGAVSFPYVSEGCREIYGLEPAQIMQDASLVLGAIHPGDRTAFQETIAGSARALHPWQWEGRFVLPSGETKWVQAASRPERQDNGDILWDGLLLDITQRKAAEQEIAALHAELSHAYEATIEGWSRALDFRDRETEGHCQRVTEMTIALARQMGLAEDALVPIRRGALLHDIGKMGVPDSILLKPGPLTDDEWIVMKLHPFYAYEMLSPIAFLRPALDIPSCHHEKWNGTGYPRGLTGENIPFAARLFAVVDVWDALRSDRPYRKGWPEEKVMAHIASLSGTHFDPAVVTAFLRLRRDTSLPKAA